MSIDDKYELKEEVGKGEFSIVYRGIERSTGNEYAIKCIEKNEIDTARLEQEVDILKKVCDGDALLCCDV